MIMIETNLSAFVLSTLAFCCQPNNEPYLSNQQLLPLTKFPGQIKQHSSVSVRVSPFQDLTKRLWENQSNRQSDRCEYRPLFSKRQIVSSNLNWGSEMNILEIL